MGNNEDGKSSKSEKPSSPAPLDQANVHVYPDWAAMQAYYGPRVALPPYYNSPVASGHAPHTYMWGPHQPMMPPFGGPYAAIYPGGVYAHPAFPLGSHAHSHGIPTSPVAVTPLNAEAATKSSGNADKVLTKKLKGIDGLAMSVGNANSESTEGGAEHRPSQSVVEGSTDGSDGNTARADQTGRKRSREGTPITGGDGKNEVQSSPVPAGVNATPDKVLGTTVVHAFVSGESVGVPSPGMPTTLKLGNASCMNAKPSPTGVPQPCGASPSETWIQNERELKRERRKQSNRESARRSRFRKQAETEQLSRKVDSLTVENVSLKSEVNQLSDKSEKLRLENSTLLEKLKNAQLEHTQEIVLNNIDDRRVPPVCTEILLSRVNNSGPVDRNVDEGSLFDKNSNSGSKLHQLLDASPRTGALAAG